MQIGRGPKKTPEDIVDLLLACHERIRRFIGMARRIAEADSPPEHELREAAAQVRRYFAEALPLHVADEEQSILPRLRGTDPELDASLATMHDEHDAHGPHLERLLALLRELEHTPSRHAALRAELAEVSAHLERDFHAHLDNEEAVILPAIRDHLDAATREEMVRELRARRAS